MIPDQLEVSTNVRSSVINSLFFLVVAAICTTVLRPALIVASSAPSLIALSTFHSSLTHETLAIPIDLA
jgi:hypothetical protein